MQTIASYLLSTPQLTATEFGTRLQALETLIEGWLKGKGASIPLASEGFFKSKSTEDDTGIYNVIRHSGVEGTVTEYTLEEKSRTGLDFTTRLSILATAKQVTLYATLMASGREDMVTQTYTNAKCPQVVREAINLFDDWHCFENKLHTHASSVDSSHDVTYLAQRLRDEARRLPVVVVSAVDGEEIWPNIAEQIAYDLSGAAEVCSITDDAASELTNTVGKINSCYLGAIRIYWPKREAKNFPRSTVWTASQLLPEDELNDKEYSSRFRANLRSSVFAAMSVSLHEPKEITSIKRAEIKERISKLEARADDHEAALKLIDELQKKNDELSTQLSEANKNISTLKYKLTATPVVAPQQNGPASNDATPNPPKAGEVRFYKKLSDAGSHEKFKLVNDCNHNNWQGSKPADKARKGIIRHEGRDDWSKMQHCSECTGPGMWRVQW